MIKNLLNFSKFKFAFTATLGSTFSTIKTKGANQLNSINFKQSTMVESQKIEQKFLDKIFSNGNFSAKLGDIQHSFGKHFLVRKKIHFSRVLPHKGPTKKSFIFLTFLMSSGGHWKNSSAILTRRTFGYYFPLTSYDTNFDYSNQVSRYSHLIPPHYKPNAPTATPR